MYTNPLYIRHPRAERTLRKADRFQLRVFRLRADVSQRASRAALPATQLNYFSQNTLAEAVIAKINLEREARTLGR